MQCYGCDVTAVSRNFRELAIDVIAHPDREHEMDNQNGGENDRHNPKPPTTPNCFFHLLRMSDKRFDIRLTRQSSRAAVRIIVTVQAIARFPAELG